ncbi:DUF4401 domain-containing protein [Denitrobaculum tricleocarpae]|uniref:DUF4401 domain-containing protein n=1 Tax=Denitrobaculum tricleocarpae TaxID=2591009 RepID=A0A545TTH8_9PROT|nr:DUF4401 domain-containing protein [Denitrobaculum tricleocarpae]TQV80518.1 DUF4401 domain-containing protein [Denitrobaculum tricleocarpae]
MSRYMTSYSASDLLRALSAKGFVESGDQELESFVLAQQQETELPLYIRALVGVGAFIASICLIGLVALGLSVDENEDFLIIGLAFVALAIVLQKFSGNGATIRQSFMMQSSFAFMATGKSLFVFALVMIFESGWAGTLATLGITVATYYVYRMSVDRFLSSFAVLFSIHLNVAFVEELPESREIFFNLFVFCEVLLAALLTWSGKIRRDFVPVKYALFCSLCVAALFLVSRFEFAYAMEEEVIRPLFMSLLFAGALIAAIAWIAGGPAKLKSEALILACLGAAALGAIAAPGITLAILLMVLGYGKHEKIMIAMGALLLPLFLYHYYYELDVSLLQKSGVLVGSGLLLLAARFYLHFRKLDQGDTA